VVLRWRAEEDRGVWRGGDSKQHEGHKWEVVEGDRESVQRNRLGENRVEAVDRERRGRGQEKRT